jgi:hypothetical protein
MSKTCKCAEDYIAQIKQLQDEVVFGLYEDEYPSYVQGYTAGLNELSSPMTAMEANGLIKIIRKQNVLINKAIQLCEIAEDWNLNEVSIDGEMISTSILKRQFIDER